MLFTLSPLLWLRLPREVVLLFGWGRIWSIPLHDILFSEFNGAAQYENGSTTKVPEAVVLRVCDDAATVGPHSGGQ